MGKALKGKQYARCIQSHLFDASCSNGIAVFPFPIHNIHYMPCDLLKKPLIDHGSPNQASTLGPSHLADPKDQLQANKIQSTLEGELSCPDDSFHFRFII